MKKIEKFLIAQNDMVENPGSYIYHTRKPRFLIEITDLNLNSNPDSGYVAKSLVYVNTESLPEFYELTIIDNIDNAPREVLEKILHFASKWYKEYLKWEDGENAAYLQDYNEHTPGLKIIYSSYAKKWVVVYKGEIHSFDFEPEMDEYLYSLGFLDTDLDQGFVLQIE